MRKSVRNMTEGSVARHLLLYAVPAVLGDLFQVTYNTVDSIIVGKYAGPSALAAVGIASPLMNIAMFFIMYRHRRLRHHERIFRGGGSALAPP